MYALHLCCAGAKCFSSRVACVSEATQMYTRLCSALIEAGAKVDSHDLAGTTPLGLCVGMTAVPASEALVPILLKHGANPNSTIRIGAAITNRTMSGTRSSLVRTVLKAGATLELRGVLMPLVLRAYDCPAVLNAITEVRRVKMLVEEKCVVCRSLGA